MSCRHLSIGFACLALFLCCGLAKADDTVANEIKKRNQLYTDVFLLKSGVDQLQMDVEVLNKRSETQMDLLKIIKSHMSANNNGDDSDGVCTQVADYFNSTHRKYNMFEERIIIKLDEIQEEQTNWLNKILVRQNLAKGSQSSAALDLLSTTLGEISEKIDTFKVQLNTFDALEQKLKEQQKKFEDFTNNQLKLLQAIDEKLSKNQEKFDAFQQQLPNLEKLTENVAHLSPPKKARLPMDIILGLTQNQSKAPPATGK